ncbi:MAG: DEAD/DEAH box helicase [Prevotellaceae bacterium]|jgi:ATP-dependent RNA helicase DeaD|nr:DEAD/DEAH box helicase [Prevotellaceae bacterium]
MTFKELGLKEEILRAVEELGFEEAMPVQERSIPFMMNDTRDLIALAQTGTGKTAGFGLPILQLINPNRRETQALVLAPTRELCIQIANDLKNFSKYQKDIKVVPVYGGENIITQLRQLDVPPQILVATPGRLIDLMERRKVNLSAIDFLVLDEADEMLNMGFQEDLETILERTPDTRRTMLFSATMPAAIARISQKYMREREEISIGKKNSGNENVEHIYYVVQAKDRYLALKRVVDLNPDIYGIVFCRTRQETKDVADKLMRDGYNADALHGDLSQAQRDAVMQKFRIKNLQILVATDVAARGLDVNNLSHVINYNLPADTESYTHRSGRTGRANRKGVSVSIIHIKERNKIREIERAINRQFEQQRIPNGMEVCKKQLFHLIDRMENVEVNYEQLDPMFPEILKKLSYLNGEEIVKRFVSLEFNRFLDYYKDAPDLNLPGKPERSDDKREKGKRKEKGEKWERGERRNGGGKLRLKINLGSKDGISPRRLLGIINDTVDDRSISVGDIEISNKFTFFDVFADRADRVLRAFEKSGGDVQVSVVKGNRQNDDAGNNSFSKRKYKEKSTGDRKSSPKSGGSDKPWRKGRR